MNARYFLTTARNKHCILHLEVTSPELLCNHGVCQTKKPQGLVRRTLTRGKFSLCEVILLKLTLSWSFLQNMTLQEQECGAENEAGMSTLKSHRITVIREGTASNLRR